ncbi:MAG: cytochrome c3 family protein [Siculibacillus sp.]
MGLRSKLLTVLLFVATLVGGGLVGAATGIALEGGVPLPSIPKATAGTCVAPPAEMRRAHPDMLKHTRDVTLRGGDRTAPSGLGGCIECHQVKGADGRAVTVSSPQHFCRSCHDYAAVKVDCFECHASRPEASKASSLDGKGDVAALAGWLEEKAR